MDNPAMHFCAVIPAYNEVISIARVIHGLRNAFPDADVVVVDDGSTDGTAEAAARAGAIVVRMPFNSGYGVALQTGLRWADRTGARCAVTLDADGQHDPLEVRKLLGPVCSGAADIVVGSRYLSSGAQYRVPLARRLGSWLFARMLCALTGNRITDPTSGFQCLNRAAIRLFSSLEDFPEMTPDADMLLYGYLHRLRIAEVAVAMYADEGGRSMHGFVRSFFYAPKMIVALAGVLLSPRVGGGPTL